MAEAVQWAEGITIAVTVVEGVCVEGHFGRRAEDEVGGAVAVDGVVATEGVKLRAVGRYTHGSDAEATVEDMRFWLSSAGDGDGFVAVAVGGAHVPELDNGIALRGCGEKVWARRTNEGERGD